MSRRVNCSKCYLSLQLMIDRHSKSRASICAQIDYYCNQCNKSKNTLEWMLEAKIMDSIKFEKKNNQIEMKTKTKAKNVLVQCPINDNNKISYYFSRFIPMFCFCIVLYLSFIASLWALYLKITKTKQKHEIKLILTTGCLSKISSTVAKLRNFKTKRWKSLPRLQLKMNENKIV